ncbi:hypothetical protein H2204_015021 [Knufia peltigerae]|uniref:Crotonase n=1 Tax=Knufia peltigerae TaxID=1002370 RepID=A0AA39CLI7_9EURO|nr:hypothetical protein H2204_015021 [Knufia peltigerae]
MHSVNGPGVGYGLTSIALFDLVYSVPEAYFFVPFVKWGLCAEACSSFTLPYVLGRQRASKLLLAQDRISAEELRGAGLISELVNGHELMSVVMDTASRLVELPPDSLIVNKRLMMLPHRERLLQANTAELKALRERVRSHEAKSAIKGFIKAQRNQNSVQSKL